MFFVLSPRPTKLGIIHAVDPSNQPVVGVGQEGGREVGTHAGQGSGVAVLLAHCIFRNISVALHAAPFPPSLPIPSLSRSPSLCSLPAGNFITSQARNNLPRAEKERKRRGTEQAREGKRGEKK